MGEEAPPVVCIEMGTVDLYFITVRMPASIVNEIKEDSVVRESGHDGRRLRRVRMPRSISRESWVLS